MRSWYQALPSSCPAPDVNKHQSACNSTILPAPRVCLTRTARTLTRGLQALPTHSSLGRGQGRNTTRPLGPWLAWDVCTFLAQAASQSPVLTQPALLHPAPGPSKTTAHPAPASFCCSADPGSQASLSPPCTRSPPEGHLFSNGCPLVPALPRYHASSCPARNPSPHARGEHSGHGAGVQIRTRTHILQRMGSQGQRPRAPRARPPVRCSLSSGLRALTGPVAASEVSGPPTPICQAGKLRPAKRAPHTWREAGLTVSLGAKAGASLVGPRWVLPAGPGAAGLVEGAGGAACWTRAGPRKPERAGQGGAPGPVREWTMAGHLPEPACPRPEGPCGWESRLYLSWVLSYHFDLFCCCGSFGVFFF